MAGYTKKITYIYMTQVCSMILGMLSMLIVTPFITSNKEVYGIYAVCLSLTVFFSYADIGFLSASIKYAAEAYIKGERKQEMEIHGFSLMVLLIFMGLICLGLLGLSYRPTLLIQGVSDNNFVTARYLLLILACSTPVFCFRRICMVVYNVRMQDYYFQIISIVGSVIKLALAPFFFMNGEYNIVSYFLTIQIIGTIVVFLAFYIAHKKLGADVVMLIKSVRFTKHTYDLLSGLAYASLFSTICWILYYEIDNIVISRLLGAEAVATFAVAFSILAVFRSLFGIMFGPFKTRFNYFVGLNDVDGINTYVKHVIEFFVPICSVPIIVMVIVSRPFIYSWVGPDYDDSVLTLSALLMCNALAFISYPSSDYITAINQRKYLYYISLIVVVVYWLGVLLSYQSLGVVSFAIMKALGMMTSALYAYVVMFYLIKESLIRYTLRLVKVYLIPTLLSIGVCLMVEPNMFSVKGRDYFLLNVGIIGCLCLICYLFYFLMCKSFRKETVGILGTFVKK